MKEQIEAAKAKLEEVIGKEKVEELYTQIETEEHANLMVVDALTEKVLEERVFARLQGELDRNSEKSNSDT